MNQQAEKSDEERAWEATPDMVVITIMEQVKTFYGEGRLDRARELLEKVVKMRPAANQAWAFLGVIHRRQDRLVKALQCLQTAVELDSSDRNALVNLAETLTIVGKVEEGVDLLRAVFEMGYVQGEPPEEQDIITRRAGSQLAILQKVWEAKKEEEAEAEEP